MRKLKSKNLKALFNNSFLVVAVLFILLSCESSPNNDLLPDASGAFTDITIVIEEKHWDGPVGDVLKDVFRQQIDGLYNLEYNFDLINVKPDAFSKIFKQQRYLILVIIDKKVKQKSILFKDDVYAKGQLFAKIEAKTVFEATKLIEENRKALLFKLEEARGKDYGQKVFENRSKQHLGKLQKEHKLNLMVPKEYQEAKFNENFAYYSLQGKALCDYGNSTNCYFQNGIFVYHYPYTSHENFKLERLIQVRDSITKIYIQGVQRDSVIPFMEVEKQFSPVGKQIDLNGKFCYQINGWWNMVNATMGGPFISVTVVDEQRNRVITAEAFSFAPNFNKRRFLYELEAIVKTIKPL